MTNNNNALSKKHLWEVDHPYYCNESNFFQRGDSDYETNFKYKSFNDFMAEWGSSDEDMNLVFRWDWKEETDDDGKLIHCSDDNYRNGKLSIFYMMQRKGYHSVCEIEVCRNDEKSVIDFLKTKFEHIKKLWEPIYLY